MQLDDALSHVRLLVQERDGAVEESRVLRADSKAAQSQLQLELSTMRQRIEELETSAAMADRARQDRAQKVASQLQEATASLKLKQEEATRYAQEAATHRERSAAEEHRARLAEERHTASELRATQAIADMRRELLDAVQAGMAQYSRELRAELAKSQHEV